MVLKKGYALVSTHCNVPPLWMGFGERRQVLVVCYVLLNVDVGEEREGARCNKFDGESNDRN